MKQQILGIVANFVITGGLGYALATIKGFKRKASSTNKALKIMLQNNLTNTYYVYSTKKKIPDYVYQNWLNMLEEYENLEGDDYIHTLAEKMKTWELTRTDILNN